MVRVRRRQHRHRRHLLETTVFAALFLLHFFFSVAGVPFSHTGIVGSEPKSEGESGSGTLPGRVLFQRRVGGPGSTPPMCIAKCGRCAPCRPIHVPIRLGLGLMSTSIEYYPEAWRCKCWNKLFKP